MQDQILIIEDTGSLATVYEECLQRKGYRVRIADKGSAALEALSEGQPQAILLDLKLPDMKGLDILRRVRMTGMNCPVVVITGQASLNTAIEAMQSGADDFIAKPVDPERLQVTLSNAIEKHKLQRIVGVLQETNRETFCGFIGRSPEMQAAYRMMENAARSRASVMIIGESGTGKEIAAKAIHSLSERKAQGCVALNCAAIPHELLESEIFGHVKGAFTGATIDREGAARRANGGTLFLDELTEMPVGLQSKILRFIQEGTFSPVGSSELYHVDIRFICATNRNPFDAIRNGLLREDLYYRLAVIPITLPPLRERGEDILLLADYFLEKASRMERKNFSGFTDEASDILIKHTWPGNVRELENIIRHTVIMNNGGKLEAGMLAVLQPHRKQSSETVAPSTPLGTIRTMAEVERETIENALAICKGNVTEAARRLGINPSTIHRKQNLWASFKESV